MNLIIKIILGILFLLGFIGFLNLIKNLVGYLFIGIIFFIILIIPNILSLLG